MQQKRKNFHRHFETPGLNLYWIIIAYIIVGWFYPVVGLIALICMIGPVMTSIWKGRWWCGHVCPRGNMYDVLYLWHVRHPTHIHRSLERGRFGYVEWYWSRVLDNYRDDYHSRRYAEFHLCATHLVLVLSDGYYLPLGGSEEGTATPSLYKHPCIECLSDALYELCPRLSDATHTLRQPWAGNRLSRFRLSEMW